MGGAHPRYRSRRNGSVKSIAIIGPNGQLGSDLVKGFDASGWAVVPAGHDVLTVESPESVADFFASHPVDVIVDTAAFHQVAVCEQEPGRTWAVNATGPRNVAAAANAIGATSVFISTDYVFDGAIADDQSYPENAPVSPLNAYGASKAAGEFATLGANQRNLVVRISSVFGAAGSSGKGGNFVEAIAKKALAGEELKVVDDIFMSPSYTVDVAAKLRGLLDSGASGVFHACNAGRITWHEFATEICKQVGADVAVERTSSDFTTVPKRPGNSSLSTARLREFGVGQRPWDEALGAYLREKGHIV